MRQRLAMSALTALVFLGSFGLAAAQTAPSTPSQPVPYWPGPSHMWGDGYGWHMWGMFPFMFLILLLVCAVAMFALGRSHHGPWRHMGREWGSPTHSALQILNERFARGEIEKQEYEEKKAVLLAGGPR